MDKDMVSTNHNINISNRKSINISGVKKIENFDESEFLLETNMGYLKIDGTNLEIIKLDTYQGDVSIKGKINTGFYYRISAQTFRFSAYCLMSAS